MKKSTLQKRLALLLLLCGALTFQAKSQGYLKASGQRVVNGNGEEVILRGMGIGGWMLQEGYMLRTGEVAGTQHQIKGKIEELVGPKRTAAFYDAWHANHMRKIDVDSLAAWGFNSIRLPMHYNLYTLPTEKEPVKGQNTWLPEGFAMTDSLLAWCKANHIYLILDLHATPGGQGNDLNISDRDPQQPALWESKANRQKMVVLWRKLAERYKDEPWIGGYDIINEPNWGFTNKDDKNGCDEEQNAPLRQLMVDITRAIREVDQRHLIVIEGNCWGNNYKGVLPTWDDNMVLSFHKYWNYNDQASIRHILDTRQKYNVPVWLGETGENSNLWYRDAIYLLEKNNIGWSWWPLKKLGFNNPLEIKVNPGYQRILDYWNGKGPKPTADAAYEGLMQLAENTKLENCIYHKDVVDAMFRQVRTAETKPFVPHRILPGATVQAVDYDLGRNRFAYFDTDTANYYISTGGERTSWNNGHMYRNDGVDIGLNPDNQHYYVTDIADGEWLQYTVDVAQKGTYTVQLQVSSGSGNGKVALLLNGKPVAQPVTVPNTGGDHKWQTVQLANVPLVQGRNVLRVRAEKGGFSLNSLEFAQGGKAAGNKGRSR